MFPMARMLGSTSDIEALARKAKRAGWTVQVVPGSNHLRWRSPDGEELRSALTPQGSRSTTALRLRLAKADPATFGLGGRLPESPAGEVTAAGEVPVTLGAAADACEGLAAVIREDYTEAVADPDALAELLRDVREALRAAENDLRAANRRLLSA